MPRKLGLPALLTYNGEVLRTAGYRVPLLGDRYVSKDGHVKVNTEGNEIPSAQRLIVRPFDRGRDFDGR